MCNHTAKVITKMVLAMILATCIGIKVGKWVGHNCSVEFFLGSVIAIVILFHITVVLYIHKKP